MAKRNSIAAAVAFCAAVATCWAAGLAPSSSGGSSGSASGSSSETSGTTVTLDDEETVLSFSFEDELPGAIDGYEVLSEFLPDGVAIEWTGKKLKVPKAGRVKYSKKDEDFIDAADSDNPSCLTVKYNKKKKTVSGSFKVYVAKSEKSLKTYKASFSGKLGESMSVYIKKRRRATAVIE